VFAALAVAATPAVAQVNKVRPGLGDDPGMPQTRPLQLPAGVRLDGPIIGADADGGECKDKDVTVGNGRGVRVCAGFCIDQKTTIGVDGETVLDIEEGLILVSEFQEGQNGMLVERVKINMPYTPCGGGMGAPEDEEKRKRRFIVELNLQCLNESKSPSFDKMGYRMGGITTDPDLLELLGLMKNKRIETEEHQRIVGDAVYSITEGKGLTSQDRHALASLPDK
jgi:hypothetical protein